MRKIILAKNDFVKAIFTNISVYELGQLLNKLTTFKILILNKLMDLTDDDSTSGANILTIIGQNKYFKKMAKHPKGIGEINKEEVSKITVLENKGKKTTEENINQKEKGINVSKEHGTIRVSEQKNLFGNVITITPYISPKNKIIIGAAQKEKSKLQTKEKKRKSATVVNPTVKKETIQTIENKPKAAHISKVEKSKENTNQNYNNVKNNQKTNHFKSAKSRYSLQKKSSPRFALFSVAAVSFLFGLVGMIRHKKVFPGILLSLTIMSFGMFGNNKTNNKRLVKKIDY